MPVRCRLSIKQQQELCLACAQASRQLGDILGEANCLQHLGQLGNVEAADAAMGRAMGTVERALTPDHPVIADMLLSRARLQIQAGNHHQARLPPPRYQHSCGLGQGPAALCFVKNAGNCRCPPDTVLQQPLDRQPESVSLCL